MLNKEKDPFLFPSFALSFFSFLALFSLFLLFPHLPLIPLSLPFFSECPLPSPPSYRKFKGLFPLLQIRGRGKRSGGEYAETAIEEECKKGGDFSGHTLYSRAVCP